MAAVVYFIQGALGIANIAFPLYVRAQGYTVAKISWLTAVGTFPWFCKIIYGAVSDAIPLWGLRRKPYLVICSALSSLGWFFLGVFPPQEIYLVVTMSIANLGLAATDVITDGLVVEHSVAGTTQIYQGISWGSRSIGSVLAGVTGGLLAARYRAELIFFLTGMLPLISLVAALFVHEDPVPVQQERQSIWIPIRDSLRYLVRGDLKWFCLLLVIASGSAAIGTPLFFYMREELGFDEVFLGILGSVAWAGAILGCLVFLTSSRHLPLKTTLYWAIGIAFLDALLAILIRSRISALSITIVSGVLGCMVLLPFLSSAAKLAHGTGVESSLFAILASLFNLGQAGSGIVGSLVYEWMGLRSLILITACFVLLGLLVIPRIRTI